MTKQQYIDFDVFSRSLIKSRDVDPVYPFIKSTLKRFPFQPEWFCLAYTTFYSLESAMIFCTEFPNKDEWNPKRFKDMRNEGVISKIGHERRGNQRNIDNQIAMFNAMHFQLDNKVFRKFCSKFNQFDFKYYISKSIPLHGPWSTYKVAEVFEKALDYKNLKINDLGIEEKDFNSNDGPVGGLRWLFGRDEVYDKGWNGLWNIFGNKLSTQWGVDIGEVESALCKWHKIMTGKYWIGNDVCEFVELKQQWGKHYEPIMTENFHPIFWKNINHFPKQNKKVYKDTGKLLNANFAQDLPSIDIIELMKEVLS